MTIGSNLSLRLAAIMLGGFILIQALIASSAFPTPAKTEGRYLGLPLPEQAAALANAVERTPPDQRLVLVDALDGGALYSLRLANASAGAQTSMKLDEVAESYRAAAPGRPIHVEGRRPGLSRWIGSDARLVRFLAPVQVTIGLRDGSILVIRSVLSDELRAYQQRRAMVAGLGGLALLIALMLAVRQTTRPLGALSGGVRRFAADLNAPDLPVQGPSEIRDLAVAFNDMKSHLRMLIAERTRVLGAIAHDLRTYLTRLRLRAEFINDTEHRDRAVRDLDEMTSLVNDTLFLADRDTAPPAETEPVPLAEVLGEIVDAHLELGDIVELQSVSDDLWIVATPLALRRILDNLITNGVRHGSRVKITVHAGREGVDIAVEDDGPGIPMEALSELGAPFQRFDPSRSRETGGAGLGLAIVRALAARDQAEVLFEQASPSGLRVILRYPLAADQAVQ
ncbi:ATP-binding protein [Sphingomonas sp. QA11]|uniref:sensor histidine kinase n=1 Tax=Sphingomonas sp. QA11 TaxID=2950605 RepID=UPI00234AEE87|nr:ATP-binding protein [Sphingomonas sp. QA11]WCM27413.1 ATP-binding protein [Sphingomonas sp. QA11]